jgi:hypothetical protein
MAPIAMHHWEEIIENDPRIRGKISRNFLWNDDADGSAIVAVFIAALAARASDRISDVASHAAQAADRAISLVHGRKRVVALFLVPTMPLAPWLGSAALSRVCVFHHSHR